MEKAEDLIRSGLEDGQVVSNSSATRLLKSVRYFTVHERFGGRQGFVSIRQTPFMRMNTILENAEKASLADNFIIRFRSLRMGFPQSSTGQKQDASAGD